MVSMRLPDELVAKIDERAGKLGITRSQWFSNMTAWCLKNTYTIEQRGGTP
jgi:metal-responsive CopG/Arc/MetJ family transcriptional regulator